MKFLFFRELPVFTSIADDLKFSTILTIFNDDNTFEDESTILVLCIFDHWKMDSHKTRNKASRRRGGKKKFENKAVTKTPSKKEEAKKFSPLAAQRLNELTNLFSKVGSNNVYGVVVLIRWNSFQTIPIRSQDALYNNKYECSLDYGSFIPEVDKYELNGMLNQMQKFPSMDQVELKEKEYERALFWLRAFAKRPIGVVLLDLQKIIRLEKVDHSFTLSNHHLLSLTFFWIPTMLSLIDQHLRNLFYETLPVLRK